MIDFSREELLRQETTESVHLKSLQWLMPDFRTKSLMYGKKTSPSKNIEGASQKKLSCYSCKEHRTT